MTRSLARTSEVQRMAATAYGTVWRPVSAALTAGLPLQLSASAADQRPQVQPRSSLPGHCCATKRTLPDPLSPRRRHRRLLGRWPLTRSRPAGAHSGLATRPVPSSDGTFIYAGLLSTHFLGQHLKRIQPHVASTRRTPSRRRLPRTSRDRFAVLPHGAATCSSSENGPPILTTCTAVAREQRRWHLPPWPGLLLVNAPRSPLARP